MSQILDHSNVAAASPRQADPARVSLATGPWQQRLAFIVEMVRELSRQTDPQMMVQAYGQRVRQLMPSDRFLSLSRRGLPPNHVRITRSSTWDRDSAPNPWKQPDRTPVFEGGLLARLIWGDEPVLIQDLEVEPDDPAYAYLEGMGSAIACPLYDGGAALNMVVQFRKEPGAFDTEKLPEHVWMANLFGRATHNLVLRDQVKQAFDAVDRELKVVADIQRSLLPTSLPSIPTLELAAHYQTSKHAGGDYYDFFPLPDGRWGILIADVSGHGTPAAVIMAVTHSIAHTHQGPPTPPSRLLTFINRHLTARYTGNTGTFVTAFYGIYDPALRRLTYACAGHCPPRVKRVSLTAGTGAAGVTGFGVDSLPGQPCLPLGIEPDEVYVDYVDTFLPGDTIVFYTDGITEARSPSGELFGTERLDKVLSDCDGGADELIRCTLDEVERFTDRRPPTDDRTLLAARVG